MPPQLEKAARYILIALILIFAVADVYFIYDIIVSDPVGHLHIDW